MADLEEKIDRVLAVGFAPEHGGHKKLPPMSKWTKKKAFNHGRAVNVYEIQTDFGLYGIHHNYDLGGKGFFAYVQRYFAPWDRARWPRPVNLQQKYPLPEKLGGRSFQHALNRNGNASSPISYEHPIFKTWKAAWEACNKHYTKALKHIGH
jgi:hypothetical protein